MSLILRKNCQPALDAIGLTEHHVGINQNKYLVVQCECGKPFITVFGIEFNRTTPSKAEIEYATELFKTFLKKHKTAITKFITAEAAFKALPEPILPDDITFPHHGYFNKVLTLIWRIKPFNVKFTYDTEKYKVIAEPSFRIDSEHMDMSTLVKFKFNTKEFNQRLKKIEAYCKYKNEKSKINDLAQNISECEI